jgi:hypothetical protein
MSARRITLVLGTAAGAFLAAGLIPLATSPVAHACSPDDGLGSGCDTDFISATDKLFALFGVNDMGFADPDNNFEAMTLNIPSLGITDVLTSGQDPSDALTSFGATPTEALGMTGVTVNTFTDSLDPALNSSFIIPFDDPLAQLWDFLVANAFFGL